MNTESNDIHYSFYGSDPEDEDDFMDQEEEEVDFIARGEAEDYLSEGGDLGAQGEGEDIMTASRAGPRCDERRRLMLGDGDAEAIQSLFVKLQHQDAILFHLIDIDDEGRLRNVLWIHPRS
ncbi:hypothetical protein ACS0TY_026247 [Phlomoides rotata]